MQHEVEKAGFSTITLSNMPDFTVSASVPRVAAIEHPFGRTVGMPDDSAGQRAVLRATLRALVEIETPGSVIHLPFEWPESVRAATRHDYEPPPISVYLKKNVRQVFRFIKRDIPPEFQV